ncbi:hypothetical protein IMSAGC011_02701 [Lachnospiraceae bacterium]|nr:hypothetical protein IMSAGC011_02701 [Lachnospiraceae bacterium]
MKQLFFIECKKILKSIVFWIFALILFVTFFMHYGNMAKDEIMQAHNPSSLFYSDPNNEYTPEQRGLSNANEQEMMMLLATKKLLFCYTENLYEYYPFGYVKEKIMSDREQYIVLQYLEELTGLDEQAINGVGSISASENSEEIEISGGGAFILEPGKGSTNNGGQFIIEPEDWEYIEKSTITQNENLNVNDELTIQVSFERFKEIMDSVNKMIGKNSYFSWTMINLYYGESDMADDPITLTQHNEFYYKDKITGAFARYYCDSISLALLWLPAFVVVGIMIKDKRHKIQDLIYTRSLSGHKLILARYFACIVLMMIPVLLLPLKSFFDLMLYAKSAGFQIDMLAFPKYILGWILPTILFVSSLTLLLTILAENYIAILIVGIMWLLGRPSVGKLNGGNYELFDLVIRHNTLKGYGRMMQNINVLVANRVLMVLMSIILLGLSIYVCQVKQRGVLRFGAK